MTSDVRYSVHVLLIYLSYNEPYLFIAQLQGCNGNNYVLKSYVIIREFPKGTCSTALIGSYDNV